MTAANRFALLGTLLVVGALVVIAGAAIAQQASTTFYVCAKGDSIKGIISVDVQPSCAGSQRLVSWNAEGPDGPQGPEGPPGNTGPQGPQGEQGTSADIHSFNMVLNVGEEAVVVAAAGWELKGSCNEGSMVASLRHTTDEWKRISAIGAPAGQFLSISSIGVVNGLGEGRIGRVEAFTPNGDVFIASEGSSIVAAVSSGASCLFAGAPHIQGSS